MLETPNPTVGNQQETERDPQRLYAKRLKRR